MTNKGTAYPNGRRQPSAFSLGSTLTLLQPYLRAEFEVHATEGETSSNGIEYSENFTVFSALVFSALDLLSKQLLTLQH